MKTNDAPDRIYIANNVFPIYVDWDGSPINTKRIDNHDIEYIRTDAFIEKARKWFEQESEYFEFDGIRRYAKDDFEDFRNYMERE